MKSVGLSPGHNSVLFDFDSLIDIRLGVIVYMRNLYKDHSKSSTSYIDYYFLYQPLKVLRNYRVYQGDTSIINIFKDEYKQSALKIEKEIIDKELQSVLDLAPRTSMIDVIKRYKESADGAVHSTIYCSDEIRYTYAKKHFNEFARIIQCNPSEISVNSYTRFIVADIKKFISLPGLEFKSLAILNYAENFISKTEYGSLDGEFLIANEHNEIVILPAYRDTPIPEG